MSTSGKMSRVENVHKRMINQRREMQYKVLVQWDRGKISGIDCIEQILELEKIIPFTKEIIKGSTEEENPNEHRNN